MSNKTKYIAAVLAASAAFCGREGLIYIKTSGSSQRDRFNRATVQHSNLMAPQ